MLPSHKIITLYLLWSTVPSSHWSLEILSDDKFWVHFQDPCRVTTNRQAVHKTFLIHSVLYLIWMVITQYNVQSSLWATRFTKIRNGATLRKIQSPILYSHSSRITEGSFKYRGCMLELKLMYLYLPCESSSGAVGPSGESELEEQDWLLLQKLNKYTMLCNSRWHGQ